MIQILMNNYHSEYRKRNIEVIKKNEKKWRELNSEYYREYMRKYMNNYRQIKLKPTHKKRNIQICKKKFNYPVLFEYKTITLTF